ncbi:MAG: hypothetical protein Kow0081_2390 [Candidatus Dojkabacteria bacterium]
MAATMKHRRSKSKRDKTRGDHRYDKVLRKFKKIKKLGGSMLVRSKITGELVPAHKVSNDNPEYKSVKVISEKN